MHTWTYTAYLGYIVHIVYMLQKYFSCGVRRRIPTRLPWGIPPAKITANMTTAKAGRSMECCSSSNQSPILILNLPS